MSGVITEYPSICMRCPCNELKILQEEVKTLRKFIEDEITRIQLKDIVVDRKRILKLEESLPKIKDSLSKVSTLKSTGSWGVAQARAEIVYSRLLTIHGNGRAPFFSTGDVKKILGVINYSQAKAAISECARLHPDTRISVRGKKKIGIERLDDVPVPIPVSIPTNPAGGRKPLW